VTIARKALRMIDPKGKMSRLRGVARTVSGIVPVPAADDSPQGYATAAIWTPEYVQELAGYRTDGYNKAFTKPLSDMSNRFLLDCKNVLDVGCGWMPYTPDERYTGTDVSEAMLARAQKLHPDTRFVHANAYDLPFSDGEFEGVRSSGMLRHMKDWRPALREMLRVATKKVTFTHLIGNGEARCGRLQWHTSLKSVCDLLPTPPMVYVVREWASFCSVLFLVEL